MSRSKIQITIDEELLREVDNYCDKNYMNRSWLISQALVQVINQQRVIDAIGNISLAIRKAVECGSIDENTKKELEEFEALCRLFNK